MTHESSPEACPRLHVSPVAPFRLLELKRQVRGQQHRSSLLLLLLCQLRLGKLIQHATSHKLLRHYPHRARTRRLPGAVGASADIPQESRPALSATGVSWKVLDSDPRIKHAWGDAAMGHALGGGERAGQ